MTKENKCASCIHCEMCRWIDEVNQNGCDFYAEPCEDAISRQIQRSTSHIIDNIRTFPTVTPARPKGKWVRHENARYSYDRENGELNAGVYHTCNLCGRKNDKENYCPNCGAEMEVTE